MIRLTWSTLDLSCPSLTSFPTFIPFGTAEGRGWDERNGE